MATPCEERGYKVGDLVKAIGSQVNEWGRPYKDHRTAFKKGLVGEIVAIEAKFGCTRVSVNYHRDLGRLDESTIAHYRTGMTPSINSCITVVSATEQTKENNFMSNVVKKIRNLALNKDERLLREMSLVDEQGQRTSDGTDVLLDILFAERRKEIVEKATELKAQEKEDKE